MLCPRCYGKHVVTFNGSSIPCPECAGMGEIHCCDGMREQECPPVEIPKFHSPNVTMKAEDSATRS